VAQRRDTGSSKRATPGGQAAAPHGQRGLSPAARATALTLATRNARFLAHLRPSRPIGSATPAFAAGVQRRYGALSDSSWPREEGAFAGDSDLGLTVARITLRARPARQSVGAPADGDALATPSASTVVGTLAAEPLPRPSTSLAASSSADETVPAPPSPRRSLSAVDPRLIRPVTTLTTLETAARHAPRSAAGVTLPDMVVTRPMDDRRAQEANSGIARRQPAHVMAALGRPLPLSVVRTPPRDNEETDWSVTEGRETASNVAPFTSLPGMFDLAASLQRKPEPGAPSPNTAQRVGALRQAAQSTGQPLDAGTRRAMQTALGAELPDVRVHADTAAAEAASALGAQAFTLGDAVYFAQGAFAPHTANGAALLGHELVHTLQQAAPAPQQQPFQAQDHGAARRADLEQARGASAGATSDRDAALLPAGDIPVSGAPTWLPSAVDAAVPIADTPAAMAQRTPLDMPLGSRAGIMSGEHIALFAQDPAGVAAAQGSMAYRAAEPGSAGVSPVPVTGSAGVSPVPVTFGPDEQRGERHAHPDTGQAVAVGPDIGVPSSLMRGVDVVLRTGAMRRVAMRAGSPVGADAAGWDAGFWPVAPGMGLLLDGAPVGASRSVYAALDMARALNGAPARMGVYGAGTGTVDTADTRAGRPTPIGRSLDQPAYAATGRSLPFVGMWGHAQRTVAGTVGVGDERGAGSADSQPRVTIARSATSAGDALPGALDLAAAIGRKASVAMDMPVLRRLERQGAAPGQDSIIVARGRFSGEVAAGPAGLRAPALSGTLNSVSRVAPVVAPGGTAAGPARDAQMPDAPNGRPATSGTGGIGAVGSLLDGTAATAAGFEAPARMDHLAYQATDSAAARRADVLAPSPMVGRADVFAMGATEAALIAQRGLEARGGDGRVADDVMAVSTMFPSLAGLAALQSFLPAALEGVSSSRAGSHAGQASGSFYGGSWQPIFVAAGSTPRSLTPSVAAAPGDAAIGLARGAVAPGSASEHASAVPASTTTPGGLGTTTPELLAGPAMSLPGMGTAEVSGQTSRHPLQQTATFRRGVDLSRSMSASAGSFAESLELEDQAARAESAVLRLFSSTPMARPAVSMATLSPATMGSRKAALSGPNNGGSTVARRSDGALVSSMPALSLSYAARTSAGPSLTAGAGSADPVLFIVPTEVRRVAGGGAAASPAGQSAATVAETVETTPNDMRGGESSAWERVALPETPLPSPQRQLFTGPANDVSGSTGHPGGLRGQPVVASDGQRSDTRRAGLTPSTGHVAPLAVPSVPADPFGLAALDLGARAQTAWLGAMGIRGPVRASADLLRLGETPTTPEAAMLPAGGQGQGRFGGEQSRSSGALSASVAGALAGSTILPGMVSLAAGVQRQGHVGASTPALQRRLEALEQASSSMSAGRPPAPAVRRGAETASGGDLSVARAYADTAVSGGASTAAPARAFSSGDAAPALGRLSPAVASGAAPWEPEPLRAGQQAAGIPGVTVAGQSVQSGAGVGDALSSMSEAETSRTGPSASRQLARATSGRTADASPFVSLSMLTLAATPLIGLEAPMIRTATDMQGDTMTLPPRSVGAFVGASWGTPIVRPVILDRTSSVTLTPVARPSESNASERGSRQFERATVQTPTAQPGQPGPAAYTGYSGSGTSIIAWLPNGVGGDGRVDRAATDRSGSGSRDGSTPVIRTLMTGESSAREAQANGPGLDVGRASGAWWAGSAAPALARLARVQSKAGYLDGVGLSSAVAHLLNGGEIVPSSEAGGPGGDSVSQQRWAESGRDMAGGVYRALDSGEGLGQRATPPDPAALVMAHARDGAPGGRAANTGDATLSRRSETAGRDSGTNVPAALAGAMAASAMLPGMLSLAASVQRKAEAGAGASRVQTLGQAAAAHALELATYRPEAPVRADAAASVGSVLGTQGRVSAVARLLDDAAAGTAGGTGLDVLSMARRGDETGPDMIGRVHRALVDRGDVAARWSVSPDPAALLMARVQDGALGARAAETGGANSLRRLEAAGRDSGMSALGVPEELSGAMATSTMLPGMLSLAASVQRKAEAGAGTPGLQRRLQALEHVAGSTGRPLESTVRRGMETVLGGDLSGVRVHADTAAAGAASMLGARAFALGNAVYFSQGAYAPRTAAGAALLAHELAHTRQQAAGALDAPQRSALPGHEAGEGEPPELEAHAQRTEASVLRLFSDAPLARQADATGGTGGLADMLSRRAEGGAQEASSGFSAAGPGAMLRRTAIATPSAGTVARTAAAAGAEFGSQSSSGSGGTLAGGMTVIGFPGATGSAAQRTAQMDPAGGNAAVSRQSGDGVAGALPQAGNVAGHALPGVDELVGQVIDRVKRQIALDHERSGGFLSDLMR